MSLLIRSRCVNVGALAGIATTFMEKDIGFWAAFLMPTSVFAFGVLIFLLNQRRYDRFRIPKLNNLLTKIVDQRPKTNILPVAAKACWYGLKGGGKMDRAYPEYVLEKYKRTVSWDSVFVEELKTGLTACRAL